MAMDPPPPLSLFSGSTRKQNVACDACRAKKIRCQRITTTQRCGQCAAKDLDCTSNYIEQLQSKPRRPRRFRSNEDRDKTSHEGDQTTPPSRASQLGGAATAVPDATTDSASSASSLLSRPLQVDDAMAVLAWMNPGGTGVMNGAGVFSRSPTRDAAAQQADMLRFLFCPVPVMHHDWRYSDVGTIDNNRGGACDMWEEQGGAVWDEPPTTAHMGLWAGGEPELEGIALELIDMFFTVVEPRIPIFDASSFMARFQDPANHLEGPLPHALLAVVLAFGAKFVDHNLFSMDRKECTARDGDHSGRTRSRLLQVITIRAREVAEANKTFRSASLWNVQTLILMESLFAYSSVLKTGYAACNLAVASRLLEQLGMQGSLGLDLHVFTARDQRMRTELAIYIGASMETALFRLRPDSWAGEAVGTLTAHYEKPVDHGNMPPGWCSQETFLGAARTAAGIANKFCNEVWQPRVRATGIPLAILREFLNDHSTWRDLYLTQHQMPADWLAGAPKKFDDTMRAITTDVFYHAMWLVVERAVRDYGIMEGDAPSARHMAAFEVQGMRQRLESEALHSALRIVLLATYATEHGLLRLDPLVLYRPIYDAGLFLARNGRDEALGAVMGLRQYSHPYPQVWDLANDIEMVLTKANPISNTFATHAGATSMHRAVGISGLVDT